MEAPRNNESSLSFTQGLLVGQLSVVILIGAFIKFFIFGERPSTEMNGALHITDRRSRSLTHKRSLVSLKNSATRRYSQPGGGKRSGVLRNPAPLTTTTILNKTFYNVDSHRPESLDWFNVLIAQTIAQFRKDAHHDDAILTSLTKALNGSSRPDFLDEITVTELSLGEDFPIFSNCQVIPVDEEGLGLGTARASDSSGSSREYVRLQARMDVDLSDMISLAVETKLLLNYPKPLVAVLPVALAVSVVRFSGTLSISFIPGSPLNSSPTTLAFSFLDDYRLDLSIWSLVGSRSKLQDIPKIAQLVETRLRTWFDERCVQPRFQQIELPSFWPRKKNTRGGDEVGSEPVSGSRTRGKDIERDLYDETKEVDVESRKLKVDEEDGLRWRRPRSGEFFIPGSISGLAVT